MPTRIPLLVALAAGAGCATGADLHGAVTRRASFDLQCSPDELEVLDLPGRAYGVRGCGKQASYVLAGGSCQNPRWLTPHDAEIYCTPVLDYAP